MPVRKDINFNSGFTGCNDRMAILKNETVPRRLDEFTEIQAPDISTDMYVYVDDGEDKRIRLGEIANTLAFQADWDETDKDSYSYIKNKPEVLNAALPRTITSLYKVGGIDVGDVFYGLDDESGHEAATIYDVIEALLSTTKDASVLFGVIDEIPATWTYNFLEESNFREIEFDAANILLNGLPVTFTANNQYYVLAVPKVFNLEVSDVMQDGFSLSFNKIPNAINNMWDIYLPTFETFPDTGAEYARTTGTFTITYKFSEIRPE